MLGLKQSFERAKLNSLFSYIHNLDKIKCTCLIAVDMLLYAVEFGVSMRQDFMENTHLGETRV